MRRTMTVLFERPPPSSESSSAEHDTRTVASSEVVASSAVSRTTLRHKITHNAQPNTIHRGHLKNVLRRQSRARVRHLLRTVYRDTRVVLSGTCVSLLSGLKARSCAAVVQMVRDALIMPYIK